MSTLIYNDIEIGITKTDSVTYTPQFDDGGSYQWTKVDITVSGLVNPKVTSYAGNPPVETADQDPADSIVAIRSALLQPRQELIYEVNAEKMIWSPDPVNQYPCDPNRGPFPGPLVITRVDGVTTLHVRFSVTTYLVECIGNTIPSALITNTFSQTHSINAQQLTTITTTGQALFRADILEDAQTLADDYRDLLVQPCPKGFQPTAMDFAITPARNAITYRYIFVEKMYDLGETDPRLGFTGGLTGSGAIEAVVERTVSSTGTKDNVVGYMTMHGVTIKLTGTKAASNWNLTQLAFSILQSMLPIGNPAAGYISQISVYQLVTGRSIGLKCEMLLNPVQAGKISIIAGDDLREDGIFPAQGGLNPGFLNRGGTAGTYANELKASEWKSLCQLPVQPKEGYFDGDGTGTATSPVTGPVVSVGITDVLPPVPNNYSYETSNYPYTLYEINTSYPIDPGVIMCPIASGGSQFGSGPDDTRSGPTAEFLTLAMPTTRMVIDIVASRVNFVPALPELSKDPNLVLLEAIPAFKAPELLPDGQSYMYYASIRLVYGMKRPKKVGDDFNVGASPYTTQYSMDNFYNGSNFVPGIADGQPTDPGAGDNGQTPVGPDGPIGPSE